MHKERKMPSRTLASALTLMTIYTPALANPHAHSACGTNCESAIPNPITHVRALDRIGTPGTHARGSGSLEDGSVVDLLVVYSPEAAAANGGQTGIEAKIQAGLDELNLAAMNSGVPTLFRIVHTQEIAYTQSGSMSTQLGRLRDPNDGVLDEVHDLRDAHMADLVMLVISAGDVCGIANIGVGPGNTPTPENAFSVVAATCIEGPVSAFAHEIGHNMGLLHGYDENPCTNGSERFAKGYQAPDESFRTVMDTGAGPRILHFSNPAIDFMGQATGVAIGEIDASDNATALMLAAPVVAKYRNRDINANGIEDTLEIAGGTLSDCDGNGIPDFADQDFNRNGIPDACDIANGTSDDLDLDGVPDEVEVPIIMVDDDAAPMGDGNGWSNAIDDLQYAFAMARASGDIEQIWIADGIYLPASNGHRGQGFDLISGVSLYGGFVGTESSVDDRIPGAAQTILSGDLNQDDGPDLSNREENTINTLFLYRQDEQIVLDGLIIEGGNANYEVNCGGFMFNGGGLCTFQGDIVIRDCEFRNNTALKAAGALLTNGTKTRVSNSWFHHNTAIDGMFYGSTGALPYEGWVGGVELNGLTTGFDNQFINNLVEHNADNEGTSGVYIAGGNPIFANNVIVNNTSNGIYGGGGLTVVLGEGIEIVNCTIANNTSPNAFSYRSSGVTNSRSQITFKNTIIWGNSASGVSNLSNQYAHSGVGADVGFEQSIVQGWDGTTWMGTGTNGNDPLFIDFMNGDFTLMAGSSAIDMGDNSVLPIDDLDLDTDGDTSENLPIDFMGNARFIDDPDTMDTGIGADPIVDAGAIEYQPATVCDADLNTDGVLNFFDVSAFLQGYNAMSAQADFNNDGVWNFFDVSAFLQAFNAGCPSP